MELSSWLLAAFLNVMFVSTTRCTDGYQYQRNNHRNISDLLNNLLSGYDNSVRPDFGGPPAVVEVDIMVRSMGPISEVDMTYSMDCYFRQSWVDRRLAFQWNRETLALSISMLERIWKPDTYFYNGKQSYLHTITTPNKFVRLYQDGRVLYSSRLTIKAGCPMNLEDFPMDTQRCPLKFGSFGYTTSDVLYRWNPARQIVIAEDMKLSQFDLIASPSDNQTDHIKSGHRSVLVVSFHLQRHMGYFILQVFFPCMLLIVLSWVGFWINREATADRIALGITTVLTMTFLGLEARTDLPKVPYPTALDFFVFLSFAFIFATIIQFAVVHYFTKYGSGEVYFNSDGSSEESSDEEWQDGAQEGTSVSTREESSSLYQLDERNVSTPSFLGNNNYPSANGDTKVEVIQLSSREPTPPSQGWSGLCIRGSRSWHSQRPYPGLRDQLRRESHRQRRRRRAKRTPRYNSVSKIDRASRIVFPLCFMVINLFYWYSYLSRSERIHRSDT